jgi:hypothetical protein
LQISRVIAILSQLTTNTHHSTTCQTASFFGEQSKKESVDRGTTFRQRFVALDAIPCLKPLIDYHHCLPDIPRDIESTDDR